MKRSGLTAVNLRYVLIGLLLLIFVGSAGGFYFVQNLLKSYAQDTSSLNSKASLGDQNLSALKNLQSYLKDHSDDEALAQKVVADSKQYQYQNEIISDISQFAAESGITINSYSFASTKASSTTSTAPAAPAATPPAPPSATPSTTTPAASGGSSASAASGLKSITVTVAMENPVNYTNLLNFMSRIEQNVTKMQIAKISLASATGSGKDAVTSESFDIEVYIK